MPPTWILGKSDKGWMTADAFFEYISNDFNKWVIQEGIPKPIILFIDGHKSHMSLPLSEFCHANGIILYALPPNTTHMLQPADVSVFKPLKQEWRTTVRKWLSRQEVNSSVTKLNFCPLFEETLQGTSTTDQIKNGFRKCGLFPLNPDNVDYSKCVKNTLDNLQKSSSAGEESIEATDLETAVKIIKKVESNLYAHGIDVQLIYNEIDELRPKHNKITVGSIIPLDALTIILVQDVFLRSEEEYQEVMEMDVQDNSLQESVLFDPEIWFKTMTEQKNQTGKTEGEEPEGNNRHERIEEIFSGESEEQTRKEFDNNKPVGEELEGNNRDDKIEEIFTGESGRQTREEFDNNKPAQEPEGNNRHKRIEVISSNQSDEEIMTSKDGDGIATQKTRILKVILPLNRDSGRIFDPFAAHLSFPEAMKISESKTPKVKLPSAILSQAWRSYYLKKEQEKNEKVGKAKMRKEERQAKTKEKQKSVKNCDKKKKPGGGIGKQTTKNKKKNTEENLTSDKMKCALCEEDLISDIEDDMEKNIGCDHCTSWYHLKCTDFLDESYEVAASKEYKCDLCK
ncbi:hypothetical protein JTB14_022525 [Gonioctena quinquepunctata]|nr:hypothetical protein JTB14_022525 [Gonioctena quinquepunctata]